MKALPPHADLIWADDGQPFSSHFGDLYFSRESGLEESRHVFLQHNQLPARWRQLATEAHFCIAETGFGTGLNFLSAWQLWDDCAPPGARLHFVSCEKFPLRVTDLQRALALWPELAHWSGQLLAQYSDLTTGWQHFVLAEGRVTLTLLIGDVFDTLPELDARVDAWFLDGFAPAKNPEMWQPALYQQMARLSRPGSTVATFTSAGDVRRGLQAAGFSMNRVKGYGRKREMLAGLFTEPAELPWQAPWYSRPAVHQGTREVMIIGAGLAGCSTALALARRGWQVQLIERHASPAQEASGNPQGILYCKLSPHQPPLSRFIQSAYAFSLRQLHALLPQSEDTWAACGVLQLSKDDNEAQRNQALAQQGYPTDFLRGVSAAEASAIAGLKVSRGGLYFAGGGWVNPPSLCHALLQHPNIHLLKQHEALALTYDDGQWTAQDGRGQSIASAACVVICSAADSARFEQTQHLPLKAIRGQITHLPASESSQALRTVLCSEGYVSPARHGEHHLGASFRFEWQDMQPTSEENQSNLALLADLSGELTDAMALSQQDPAALKARAALRCTSPDYLPLIGPIVQPEPFIRDYAVLGKDASKQLDTPSPWYPGLFINSAHGSRGLISCPLSGELLAALLNNEPLPLPRQLVQAVHPSRFLLRQLVRGQRTRGSDTAAS